MGRLQIIQRLRQWWFNYRFGKATNKYWISQGNRQKSKEETEKIEEAMRRAYENCK